jgi:site-specific DNA-methyltransferase (adenine-specific)
MRPISDFVNRILCGDYIAVMRQMPEASVDLVVTDPPYLVNYRSRDGRSIAGDASDAWLAPAFAEMHRVLKPDAFCVSFFDWQAADRFMACWHAAGFAVLEQLIWHKRYPSSVGFTARYHEAADLLPRAGQQSRGCACRAS